VLTVIFTHFTRTHLLFYANLNSLAVTSRLRSFQTFPKVHTRPKRYRSFIQYMVLIIISIKSIKPSFRTTPYIYLLVLLLPISITIVSHVHCLFVCVIYGRPVE